MMKFSLVVMAGLLAAASAHAAEPSPKVNALFRVLKADGITVIGQASIAPGFSSTATINVRQADAIAFANGRCAFNVKYDEVATTALSGTVNRIYSNDILIAQNTGIDLAAGALKAILTQPYFLAGVNNVKVVLNAEGASPTIGWVRVNVDGNCSTSPAPKPPEPKPEPKPVPTAPAVTPTSAGWNALYNAWGYSNYGTTQLKGKGYAKYNDLVAVNADLTKAVNAKKIERADYDKLMARWNAFANDPTFRALMAAIVPPKPGTK